MIFSILTKTYLVDYTEERCPPMALGLQLSSQKEIDSHFPSVSGDRLSFFQYLWRQTVSPRIYEALEKVSDPQEQKSFLCLPLDDSLHPLMHISLMAGKNSQDRDPETTMENLKMIFFR